ncbi:LysR family transcriptional regulator [Serratia sp. S1B]|nr:LysR family transcriptional regulator [Serratia sp. S1B]
MINNRFPLHLLPTFVIAARLENLRATAKQMNLTHGAISQQIKQLEQVIGYPLFERNGRGIQLNAAGRELLAITEPALLSLQQAINQSRGIAARKTLRISVVPSFAHYWLLPRLTEFQRTYPEIVLDIEASLVVRDIEREGLDAAIRIGNGQWPGVQKQLIASGEVIPVASPEVSKKWQLAFAAGNDETPLLEHEATPWSQWFQAHNQTRSGRQLALFNDAGLLLRAAEQGFGIALVKSVLARDAISEGRLVALAAARKLDNNDIYLIWRKITGLTPSVETLLSWLQQQLACPD